MPPVFGHYSHDHTRVWSAKIASFDGYVFVTPEHNHATSDALKNAIEFLHNEWINKAAGFIGYGGMSGARAVEDLRLIMGEVQVATVRALRPRNGGPRIASVWKRGRNGFERSRQNNTCSRILHKS